MEPCPICGGSMNAFNLGDASQVECERCGRYKATGSVIPLLRDPKHLTPRQKSNISGWVYESQNPEINTVNVEWLANLRTPSLQERADKLLINLDRHTEFLGQPRERSNEWLSWTWCLNDEELNEILRYLETPPPRIEELPGATNWFKIGPDGWRRIEDLKRIGSDSLQGFVAMWFDETMQKIYDEAIAKAILDAGYKPHRVDQREYNDKIDDEIIAQVRKSRFVVADFTGHRGGVYYEAGYAKGLNLEVFWTCEESELKDLHFDIRQYNCITWEKDKLDHFRKKLTNRIERVLGRGNYQSK